MHTVTKILPLLIATVCVGVAVATTAPQEQPQKTPPPAPRRPTQAALDEHRSQFPIADYDAAEPEDPEQRQKRHARSRRHDRQWLVGRPETSHVEGEGALINDWEVGLPTIPVAQSDAVVLGEVTDAKAYLSEDKGGVYSEFALRADEVLMESSEAKIKPGSVIVTERVGGRVRFPAGQVKLYDIAGQGMPRAGRRYVLFLKSTGEEQTYRIVTGYEVAEGRILPLDQRGYSRSKFDVHKGAALDDFLQTVRDTIAQHGQTQKGGN